MKTILLIIDPQIDFHPGGSLAVEGANQDSERTAAMIRENIDEIDEIVVTLDSHHRTHIAHAIFWKNKRGDEPAPFTLITHDDVVSGKWAPKNAALLDWCLEYTRRLKENNRFTLCIWPEHCLIGSFGHSVKPVLHEAMLQWAGKKFKEIHYVHKGMNCLTEMYSAIAADVPIESDPTTQKDPKLIKTLLSADRLLICGEAKSHCVAFTTRDLLKEWPEGEEDRIILLEDAMSPVGGFEHQADEFIREALDRGCRLSTTENVFAVLRK